MSAEQQVSNRSSHTLLPGFEDDIAFCNEHGDWHSIEMSDPSCDFQQ